MRQKIQPGMNVDFVTPEEMAIHFRDHTETLLNALGRNAIFKRVVFSGPVDSGGNIRITAACPDGFIWDLRGISLAGAANGLKPIAASMNESGNFVNLLANMTIGNPITTFPSKCIIVHATELIVISGNGLVTPDNITAMLWVVEVPTSHEAQLLL